MTNTIKIRRKRAVRKLALWTFLWVTSLSIVSFGVKYLWDFNKTISIIAILINTLIGIGMILANIRHFRLLDELQQKIQADAMGIALGVAVVGGISFSSLDMTNVIPFDAEISFLVMLIGISYLIVVLAGNARYQ